LTSDDLESESNAVEAEGNIAAGKSPLPISFAEFLASVPPSQPTKVSDVCNVKSVPGGPQWHEITIPQLQLNCTSNECNGLRFFRFKEGERSIPVGKYGKLTYFTYICPNCRQVEKIFAFHVSVQDDFFGTGGGQCYKFGEHPPYGSPTPNRLLKLFGKDSKIFLKGRQCENHALGIGAFGYYRRVVESHKNQILDEIIKVAKKIAPEMVEPLEAAKREHQFLKAIDSVKDAIPQGLLINGHNPLTLLHSALSEGLHAQTDEQCLELAHHVRVVLTELVERLGQALKDEAELNTAISRLMKPKV
jgi:hypothetical protein